MTTLTTSSTGVQRTGEEDPHGLWQQYKATGDRALRDRLVLTYAPLVKYLVYRKVRELPPHCDVEDFVSCGLIALIESIDRWDPDKGATLEQYAWTRIQGAIIDELRRQDWAPRSVRRWERDIAQARAKLSATNGRAPTRGELADALSTDEQELSRRQGAIATSTVISLNRPVGTSEDADVERIDTLASSDRRVDPEEAATSRIAMDRLRQALSRLTKRQQEVLVLLYVRGLNLREVGEVLGVSESRVCQIHSEIRRALRKEVGPDEDLFSEFA